MKHNIYLVGMGPGKEEMMTGEALKALEAADVIIGYTVYIKLLGERFADKEMRTTPMRQEEERWKIEVIDLKYKEYISSLIEYDKRVDEVLLGAVGMDSSISSVSKDGVISKSGADVYYNYLLYLQTLTPDDEKCSEPFNQVLQVNFPEL